MILKHTTSIIVLALSVIAYDVNAVVPSEFPAEQIEYFESKVRPLLIEHCYKCHSENAEKLKGGLRLDQRSLILAGGDTGPAIIPKQPDKSLLIQSIRWEDGEMPPKQKLPDHQIKILEKWVQMGAPWPQASEKIQKSKSDYDWDKWRNEYWAFQKIKSPTPPQIPGDTWSSSEIDRFVFRKLHYAKITPSPPASPAILARRIYFDLLGLPPTPTQLQAFLDQTKINKQAAIKNLVNTLLNSPQYGERWARHWLDVARYSDGAGGFLDNRHLNHAWQYRDWVVKAFNTDMPFNRFIELQIAGDLIGDRYDSVATGFFALGPTYISDGGDPDSVAQAKAETLSDRIDTLTRGMLGLTLACSRCHDHKFDPLTQKDYYSIAGIFNNTKNHQQPLAPDDVVNKYNDYQVKIKDTNNEINKLNNQIKKEKRKPTQPEQTQLDQLKAKLDHLRKTAPPQYDLAHTIVDSGSGDMNIAIRGNLRKPGQPAPRRFLTILSSHDSPLFNQGSGRLQLAKAMSDPNNPLTARVFVNRVWMHHFGNALVRTPDNFGSLGEKPTHPQLLDWLTSNFIKSGYSIKHLHRLIMLSSTYQMSTQYNPSAFNVDGDNRLLWRMNPRRLDVEAWRDALLFVSNELDLKVGGPPIDQIQHTRRTLYFKVSRNGDFFQTDTFLRLFDFPLMKATVDKRPESIVPQQFLFLMNSDFMLNRAKAFTKRLHDEAQSDLERIKLAYVYLYQREPTDAELKIGLEYLKNTNQQKIIPWHQYNQVLLSANELMYLR